MFFYNFLKTGHDVLPNSFSIIRSAKDYELKTSESIAIHKLKPSLNEMVSSNLNLYLFWIIMYLLLQIDILRYMFHVILYYLLRRNLLDSNLIFSLAHLFIILVL